MSRQTTPQQHAEAAPSTTQARTGDIDTSLTVTAATPAVAETIKQGVAIGTD